MQNSRHFKIIKRTIKNSPNSPEMMTVRIEPDPRPLPESDIHWNIEIVEAVEINPDNNELRKAIRLIDNYFQSKSRKNGSNEVTNAWGDLRHNIFNNL